MLDKSGGRRKGGGAKRANWENGILEDQSFNLGVKGNDSGHKLIYLYLTYPGIFQFNLLLGKEDLLPFLMLFVPHMSDVTGSQLSLNPAVTSN